MKNITIDEIRELYNGIYGNSIKTDNDIKEIERRQKLKEKEIARQKKLEEERKKEERKAYLKQRMKDLPNTIKVCEFLQEGSKRFVDIKRELGIDDISFVHDIHRRKLYPEISSKYKWDKKYKPTSVYPKRDTIIKICEMIESRKYTDIEIAKELDVKMGVIRDIIAGRKYKEISNRYDLRIPRPYLCDYIISTSTKDDSLRKRVIVNSIETEYEVNIFGTLRNVNNHQLVTPKETQLILGNEVACTYTIYLTKQKAICIDRNRILAHIWVPIPNHLRFIDPKYLSVGRKDYMFDGHEELNLLSITPDNLYWYLSDEIKMNMNKVEKSI